MMELGSLVVIIKNCIGAILNWILKGKNKALEVVDSDTGYQNYWHVGSQNDKPILQLVCNFMVYNNTDQPVSLANAIHKGIKGVRELAVISVKDLNSQYSSSSYPIPQKKQTSVSICFIVHPKKIPKSNMPINLKVCIIDQFGKKYWVKNILFRPA